MYTGSAVFRHSAYEEPQGTIERKILPAEASKMTYLRTSVQPSGVAKSFTCIPKDKDYFCYCAYILRISRYSGFLWVAPTNTEVFMRSLKLRRKQNLASAFGIQKENWG